MLINNCKIYCHLGIGKASIFIGIKNGSGWRGRRECKLRVVGIIRLRGNSIEYAIKHVHARNKYHSNDRLHRAWRILSGGSYSVAARNAYKMLFKSIDSHCYLVIEFEKWKKIRSTYMFGCSFVYHSTVSVDFYFVEICLPTSKNM